MKFQTRTAVLIAAFMLAPAGAIAATEDSFSALQSVEALPLSQGEMGAISGQSGATIAAALTSYAATTQNTTAASSLLTLAAAYSRITVTNTRLIVNRTVVYILR